MKKMEKYITLLELSKLLGIKKPTMSYYFHLGLFSPVFFAGKTAIFDRAEILKNWKEVMELKKTKTLSEIREIFAKKNANRKK
jgi:hypothetical protein